MSIIEEIEADIEWRISKFAEIKLIPLKYSFNDEHVKFFYASSIPIIYSIWEGFVRNSCELYIKEINELGLTRGELHEKLMAHSLDEKCKLDNPRTGFDKKLKMYEELEKFFSLEVKIPHKVNTQSNANFKNVNSLLGKLNLGLLDSRYKAALDDLVNIRNKISHGENAIIVIRKQIVNFIKLVEELMQKILITMQEALENRGYLREPLETTC